MSSSFWSTIRTPDLSPRHGHCFLSVGQETIVLFGGGDGEQKSLGPEIHILQLNRTNSSSGRFSVRTHVPDDAMMAQATQRAAAGAAVIGKDIILFGGMIRGPDGEGRLSDELFVIRTDDMSCSEIHATGDKPSPRLGHSMTVIDNYVFVFAGLGNDSPIEGDFSGVYLNDMHVLRWNSDSDTGSGHKDQTTGPNDQTGSRGRESDQRSGPKDQTGSQGPGLWLTWHSTQGQVPCGRESHSAIGFKDSAGDPHILLFGGMNGQRLNDTWILNVYKMLWTQISFSTPVPEPRSMHSAVMVEKKMIVFGGLRTGSRASNSISILDLVTMRWVLLTPESDEATESQATTGGEAAVPAARSGHQCLVLDGHMYLFGGRTNRTTLCDARIWCLTLRPPVLVLKIHNPVVPLSHRETQVTWNQTYDADYYLVQIEKDEANRLPANMNNKRKVREKDSDSDTSSSNSSVPSVRKLGSRTYSKKSFSLIH